MINVTYHQIKAIMDGKGYKWFTKPYDLNLIGIRNPSPRPDKFDDTLVVAYLDSMGNPRTFVCPITTDPGLYYLQNPMNPSGTAILYPGQYLGLWKLGKHQGKYTALVQQKPAKVIRDANKDSILDFYHQKTETGIQGINLHRAIEDWISTVVGKWSAGCQVIPVAADFNYIISLVKLQIRHIKSDIVSYTLLMESEIQ